MYLSDRTGRGVRVAVVDSGVHAQHPHVNGIFGGFAIRRDGSIGDDYVDRIGHGTAVAAAIREKAPDAELLAIKVFDTSLATDAATLVRAIDAACARGATIINLSLGTAERAHRRALEEAIARASDAGAFIVAAETHLPGCLEGEVPVQLDWACERHSYRILRANGRSAIAASGYPRDIPGVPRDRNLKGVSFAVANASGFVARTLEAAPGSTLAALFEALAAAATDSAPN